MLQGRRGLSLGLPGKLGDEKGSEPRAEHARRSCPVQSWRTDPGKAREEDASAGCRGGGQVLAAHDRRGALDEQERVACRGSARGLQLVVAGTLAEVFSEQRGTGGARERQKSFEVSNAVVREQHRLLDRRVGEGPHRDDDGDGCTLEPPTHEAEQLD